MGWACCLFALFYWGNSVPGFDSKEIQDAIRNSGIQNTPVEVPAIAAKKPSQSIWKDKLVLASMAADAGDYLSTNIGPGGVEMNPLLSAKPVVNGLEQGGLSILKALALHKLSQSHPTLAKILGGVNIAVGAFDTASNLKVDAGGEPLIPPYGRGAK